MARSETPAPKMMTLNGLLFDSSILACLVAIVCISSMVSDKFNIAVTGDL